MLLEFPLRAPELLIGWECCWGPSSSCFADALECTSGLSMICGSTQHLLLLNLLALDGSGTSMRIQGLQFRAHGKSIAYLGLVQGLKQMYPGQRQPKPEILNAKSFIRGNMSIGVI